MDEFRIDVVLESLSKQSDQAVTGLIAIRTPEIVFPDRGWSDFVVVVLSWWLREVTALMSGSTPMAKCAFMDGPYEFQLAIHSRDRWRLALLRRTASNQELSGETLVAPTTVVAELAKTANAVLRKCQENSWEDEDLKLLSVRFKELQSKRRFVGSHHGGLDS